MLSCHAVDYLTYVALAKPLPVPGFNSRCKMGAFDPRIVIPHGQVCKILIVCAWEERGLEVRKDQLTF
jgi:hypothetical protein